MKNLWRRRNQVTAYQFVICLAFNCTIQVTAPVCLSWSFCQAFSSTIQGIASLFARLSSIHLYDSGHCASFGPFVYHSFVRFRSLRFCWSICLAFICTIQVTASLLVHLSSIQLYDSGHCAFFWSIWLAFICTIQVTVPLLVHLSSIYSYDSSTASFLSFV